MRAVQQRASVNPTCSVRPNPRLARRVLINGWPGRVLDKAGPAAPDAPAQPTKPAASAAAPRARTPWYVGKERGTKLSQSRVLSEREMDVIELGGAAP